MNAPATAMIESVLVSGTDDPHLKLSGTMASGSVAAVSLSGPRLRITADTITSGIHWTARVPLLTETWGDPRLAPPSGGYSLELRDDAGAIVAFTATAELPYDRVIPRLFRVSSTAGDDLSSLTVTFAAPLTERERGQAQQARLERVHRRSRTLPIDAVFFESFYGRNVSCNPLALDRALSRIRPDTPRYWSVVDASVPVPPGSIALFEGSEEWWRVRGSARLIVVNDWLRKRFRRRRGQTVLQTWHGTPLKKIALDRPGFRPRAAVAALRERSRWDIMLAQNSYSSKVFRSAYAFFGRSWLEGYPRNDVLVHGDPSAVRARVGIPEGSRVVLYAPTWRDDRPGEVDQLDVARFSALLGPGFTLLIRGHSRSLQPGTATEARGVIDVTTYPDVSELFLVADALITDYSSVMFDFSVTGKPMYFFTPDLDSYRDQMRGFYFDLVPVAPGPVLRDPLELARRVIDGDTAEFAERYAAWRRRFNPRDDGDASDRVVRRLIAGRIIG
jgi:CDP-glycerol glycerophosphotransferase (TagB/SpsB family)